MNVQPTTVLTQFTGQYVVIDHTRKARITTIRHCQAGSRFPDLSTGFAGTCVEDPHGDCRGGSTSFWFPYGTDLKVIS